MARTLIVKTGALAGQRITVDDEIVLGRSDADFTLADPEVSGRHARLRAAGDDVEIEDLGSTNGTFVNGNRIEAVTRLSPGDVVKIGQTTLELDRPAPMTSPTPDYIVPTGAGAAAPLSGARVGSPPGATPTGAPPGSPPGLYGTSPPGAYGPQYAVPPNAASGRQKKGVPAAAWIAGALALLAVGLGLFFFVFKEGGVAREDFITEATGVCTAAEAEVGELESQLDTIENPQDAIGVLNQLNARFDEFINELEQVEAPAEDQADFDELLDLLEQRSSIGKQAVDALERGDQAAAQAAVAQGDPIDSEIKAAAEGLGINACAADL